MLFIERCKTPRHKPCSGIQFPYFEQILGEKIPADRLCKVQIQRTEMHFPDGTSIGAPFRAFNYMRNVFGDWLNQRAREEGARFRDECELVDCEEVDGGVIVTFTTSNEEEEQVKARYVVDATGLSSLPIRRKLRPQDFGSAEYAAGLLDGVRGVGQDAAALSGRLVARAIQRADEHCTRALDEYQTLTRRITRQTRKNQARAIELFETNEELQRHLRRGMLRTGVLMDLHAFLNRFRSPEKLKLLPP